MTYKTTINGLKPIVNEINCQCKNALIYRMGFFRPPHLVVNLDRGMGRTTVLSYIAKRYHTERILDFRKSYEQFIEVPISDCQEENERAFFEIDSSAVYSNEFTNLVGLDVSGIDYKSNKETLRSFYSECRRICKNATVVFFFKSEVAVQEENLISCLCEEIDNIRVIRLSEKGYNNDDMKNMIRSMIEGHGIRLDLSNKTDEYLSEIVRLTGINSPSGATMITRTILCFTITDNKMPEMISAEEVEAIRNYVALNAGR